MKDILNKVFGLLIDNRTSKDHSYHYKSETYREFSLFSKRHVYIPVLLHSFDVKTSKL